MTPEAPVYTDEDSIHDDNLDAWLTMLDDDDEV